MMGLNCTACHNGELHYNGRAFRIDGAPSMAYINNFVKGIVEETQATIDDPARLARFIDRRRRVKLVPIPNFPVVAKEDQPPPQGDPDEQLEGGAAGFVSRALETIGTLVSQKTLVAQKLQTLKAIDIVKQTQLISTEDGYGRNDAFGVGRNELFGGFHTKDFTTGGNAGTGG